jgi:hypothetical protein
LGCLGVFASNYVIKLIINWHIGVSMNLNNNANFWIDFSKFPQIDLLGFPD